MDSNLLSEFSRYTDLHSINIFDEIELAESDPGNTFSNLLWEDAAETYSSSLNNIISVTNPSTLPSIDFDCNQQVQVAQPTPQAVSSDGASQDTLIQMELNNSISHPVYFAYNNDTLKTCSPMNNTSHDISMSRLPLLTLGFEIDEVGNIRTITEPNVTKDGSHDINYSNNEDLNIIPEKSRDKSDTNAKHKRRRKYTENDMTNAIELVNNGMRLSDAARKFNIPCSSLCLKIGKKMPKKNYTEIDVSSAIEQVKNGMACYKAARMYNIPPTTLKKRVIKLGILLPTRSLEKNSKGKEISSENSETNFQAS